MKKYQLLATSSLIAMLPMASSAASILWQPSVNMYQGSTTETFVDTTGTLAVALNGSSSGGTTTVNGVAFVDTVQNVTVNGAGASVIVNASNLHNTAFQDGEFNANVNIDNLIQSAIYETTSVDFSNLTIGNEYMIQLFVNDARGNRHLNYLIGVGDGTGSASVATAELNNSPVDGSAPTFPQTDAGDSIIGRFVANATTQSFNVFGSNSGAGGLTSGAGQSHVNAIQLRDLGAPVPEPSSTALLGLGGLALILRRRK